METLNPSDLVTRLASDEDAVRKMAAFKLQGSIGDPSFADIFIAEGGLSKLRYLTLTTTGNTLAYSLTSFARLLEVDKGWEFVDEEVVERVFPINSLTGEKIGGCLLRSVDSPFDRDTSPRQHPARSDGHARFDCFASSHPSIRV